MKYCCVIGGSGFIGQHLVKQLVATGRKIKVIGRNRISPFDDSIIYLSNQSIDNNFLAVTLQNVDEVIELAYSTTPQTSFQDPVKDIADNLAVSVKVFEALLYSNIKKIVYVSSGGTIYGQAEYSPITEEHPTNPVSPYGITKLAIEKYGQMFYHTNGLPIVIVRPSNAFGEGQIPFRGQGFISTAIASIINGEPVKIFGEGNTVRDYIYVDDVATGIIAALEYGKIGECYNIGTGQGRDNIEVIRSLILLLRNYGYETQIEKLPARAFDVKVNILNSDKLKKISGWQPRMNFPDGLARAVKSMITTRDDNTPK